MNPFTLLFRLPLMPLRSVVQLGEEGRVEMRLLGPQAPYDFTPTPLPPRLSGYDRG